MRHLGLAAAFLLIAGCGDDDTTVGSGGASGATGGSAGATGGAGGSGATVSYIATITGLLAPDPPSKPDFVDLGPMVGAKVCLRGDATKCSTTDSAGFVEVKGIPSNANIAMLISHADYGKNLLQYVTTTAPEVHGPPLLALTDQKKGLTQMGCASPMPVGKGMLYIGLPAGSSVALPLSPGAKLVYFGDDGVPDPKLTAVSLTNTKFGGAVACDIAPGEYPLDVTGTTGSCQMIEGWPSAQHTLLAVVDDQTFTVVNWMCK